MPLTGFDLIADIQPAAPSIGLLTEAARLGGVDKSMLEKCGGFIVNYPCPE